MSISVNWATGVVTVPKEDMLLVQSTPIEVRELNIDLFRLALKNLEDNPAGMGFTKTHVHNTTVEISGIQLARVVEILAPYTVTFEDGSYAVNLVGANSNIADRVNLNQVSVRAANSAGLVQTRELQYASFKGAVYIDIVDGFAGTVYPVGTESNPVNNLIDAKFIAELRGFSTLNIIGDITIGVTDIISNYVIQGQGATFNNPKTSITLIDGCSTTDTEYKDCRIDGVQGGESIYTDCVIGSITNTHCKFNGCGMVGPVQVYRATGYDWVKNHTTDLKDCYTSISWYELDFNDSSLHQVYTNFSGKLKISNYSNNEAELVLQLDSGEVWLDSTCSGTAPITILGVGTLLNSSTLTNITTDGLINKNTVAAAVGDEIGSEIQYASFNGAVAVDTTSTYSGTDFPIGTPTQPVNNIPDAVYIADGRGFTSLSIIGNITLGDGDIISDMLIVGQDQLLTTITVEDSAEVVNSKFTDCAITGILDGGNIMERCRIIDELYYVNGYISSCLINVDAIYLGGGASATFMDCWSGKPGSGTPLIDMGGSGQALGIRGYSGGIELVNKAGSDSVSVDLNSGQVILGSDITAGDIQLRGVGVLTDNSPGTAVIHTEGLMSKQTISEAVLNTELVDFTSPNTVASALKLTSYADVITINAVAGSPGTVWPCGSIEEPVDNLANAKTIAEERGFTTMSIIGNLTITATDNVDNYTLLGQGASFNSPKTTITLEDGCSASNTKYIDAKVQGVQGGESIYSNCVIGAITNAHCQYENCGMLGPIQVANDSWTQWHNTDLKNCHSSLDWYEVDYNDSPINHVYTNFSGKIKFTNVTHDDANIIIQLDSGEVWLDSTCTDGNIIIRGVGSLLNESSIIDINTEGLMSKDTVAAAVWNQTQTLKHMVESLRDTHSGFGNVFYWDPYLGNDSNNGTTPELATKTFDVAKNLTTQGESDIIFALATDPSGTTTVSGNLVIDIPTLQLRGPGRNFNITSTSGTSLKVTAAGVGVSGLQLSQTGPFAVFQHCLMISGTENFLLDNIFIIGGLDDGIHIEDCNNGKLSNIDIRSSKHVGLHFKNVTYTEVFGNNIIHYCGLSDTEHGYGSGLWVDGTTHGVHIGTGFEVHNCGEYGIKTGPNTQETFIHPDTRLFSNKAGNYLSEGWEDSIGITIGTEPLEALTYRVEGLRKRAPANGRVVYYDPTLGSDTNDGHRPDRAKGTFEGAHNTVTDGGHDIIQILDNTTGPEALELDEQWVISKSDLSVRGPGWDLLLAPTSTTGNTIVVTGEEVSLEKIQVRTSSSGSNQSCIEVFSNNCNLNNMKIKRSTYAGLLVHGNNTLVEDCLIEHHTGGPGYGIRMFNDSHENNFINNFVYDCNYNMYISGTAHENVLKGNVFHDANIAGLYIGASTGHTYIYSDNLIANNATDIIDNSSATYYHSQHIADGTAESVWHHEMTGHDDTETFGHIVRHIGYLRGSIYVDTSAAVNGDGTQEHPTNTLASAIDKAVEHNIKNLYVHNDITIDRTLNNYVITGVGIPTINTNGRNLNNTEFSHCKLTGIYAGEITVQESVLLDGFNLSGYFENCGLAGDLHCIAGANVLIKDCASLLPGTSRPTISMNTGAVSYLSVRGYSGGLTIKDCDNVLDTVTAEVAVGSLTFDSSCVAGQMVARGLCKFVDETTGATVTDETVWNPTIAEAVWKESTANTTSGTFGQALSDVNLDTDGLAQAGEYTAVLDSLSSDVTDIGTDVTAIYNKLPAGIIASAGEYDADLTVLKANVERALGLAQENYYIDNTQYVDYNGAKLMTYGRMRTYSDQASVGTDNNVIGVYIVNTAWNGDEMTTYKVTRSV